MTPEEKKIADSLATKGYIMIPDERYHELIMDSRILRALDRAGVDNWEGYDHAMEFLEEEEG